MLEQRVCYLRLLVACEADVWRAEAAAPAVISPVPAGVPTSLCVQDTGVRWRLVSVWLTCASSPVAQACNMQHSWLVSILCIGGLAPILSGPSTCHMSPAAETKLLSVHLLQCSPAQTAMTGRELLQSRVWLLQKVASMVLQDDKSFSSSPKCTVR